MTPRLLPLSLIMFTLLTQTAAAADIDEAIALYAEASYEAALEALARPDLQGDPNVVDQYRALCFVALGRQLEAERALEQIVARSPLFTIDPAAVSPKLLDMFHQVRLRALPKSAQQLYVSAKAHFDRDELVEARESFLKLADVVQENRDLGGGNGLDDLLQLGDGFLALIEARLVPPPEAAPIEPVEAPPEAPTPEEGRIYSAADAGVLPPVPLERELPSWNPPPGPRGRVTIRGALEFVVDETGAVVQPSIVEPMWPPYDASVLAATRDWVFRPAMLGDTPVMFRLRLNLTLEPPE